MRKLEAAALDLQGAFGLPQAAGALDPSDFRLHIVNIHHGRAI